MKTWESALIPPTTTIIDAIKIIDSSAMQIALVVDEQRRLLGTVTDGDIRRGILKGITLDKPVTSVMKEDPLTVTPEQNREAILKLMKEKAIKQIPVIDRNGYVVKLELINELLKETTLDNWVVLMAGGLGTRLQPLTEDCPKPMVQVGGKPVLETILVNFIDQGFKKFFIAVNHLAAQIQDYFGDGSSWSVEIEYLTEDKKMGTAGALGMLPEKPTKPILVMNGDLLTKVNFKQLLDLHSQHEAAATMCVREYSFQIPYGVIKIEEDLIKEIDEKPVQQFFVNAGIYVLEPETLDLIPDQEYFEMTTLFENLIVKNMRTSVFPIREYWIDVGYYGDYERANNDYGEVFIDD